MSAPRSRFLLLFCTRIRAERDGRPKLGELRRDYLDLEFICDREAREEPSKEETNCKMMHQKNANFHVPRLSTHTITRSACDFVVVANFATQNKPQQSIHTSVPYAVVCVRCRRVVSMCVWIRAKYWRFLFARSFVIFSFARFGRRTTLWEIKCFQMTVLRDFKSLKEEKVRTTQTNYYN